MTGSLHDKYVQESVAKIPAGITAVAVGWESPSNIALIKYWGKAAAQTPRNPSLSFSLKEAVTEMKIRAVPGPGQEIRYFFGGEQNMSFEARIREYIESILPYFPFLNEFSLTIESKNTFPHSSGIASSASSMSALALCICTLEQKLIGRKTNADFLRKASFMARLGSGSAARSVYGGFASWGYYAENGQSSDEYASVLPLEEGSSFGSIRDAILIVSPLRKKISSSAGHALMQKHPFARERYGQARRNLSELITALKENDVEKFIHITENEALTLHGLMMSSDPGFVLMEPPTLEILSRIRRFREKNGAFVTFTMDAGSNVHLIYPPGERGRVIRFIHEELLDLCHDRKWIDDSIGEGPIEMST